MQKKNQNSNTFYKFTYIFWIFCDLTEKTRTRNSQKKSMKETCNMMCRPKCLAFPMINWLDVYQRHTDWYFHKYFDTDNSNFWCWASFYFDLAFVLLFYCIWYRCLAHSLSLVLVVLVYIILCAFLLSDQLLYYNKFSKLKYHIIY